MKIYTKTGDLGETGLLGGVRVSKSCHVIEVTGLLDETNCLLGVAICDHSSQGEVPADVINVVSKIQHDLFDLGSQIAACLSKSSRAVNFSSKHATQLESWIDDFDSRLEPLTAFILPGGSFTGSLLHQARAVCRKAERGLVVLLNSDMDWPKSADTNRRFAEELIYLNRLSDLLFVLARFVNSESNCPEVQWQSTGTAKN